MSEQQDAAVSSQVRTRARDPLNYDFFTALKREIVRASDGQALAPHDPKRRRVVRDEDIVISNQTLEAVVERSACDAAANDRLDNGRQMPSETSNSDLLSTHSLEPADATCAAHDTHAAPVSSTRPGRRTRSSTTLQPSSENIHASQTEVSSANAQIHQPQRAHHDSEKRYRANINEKFLALHQCLPEAAQEMSTRGEQSSRARQDKIKVLTQAVEYIKELEQRLSTREQQVHKLRAGVLGSMELLKECQHPA